MTTYTGSQSWRRYREILAMRFGIELSREPQETTQRIRDHDIHVDVWQPDGPAKGTLILVHGGGGNGRILSPFADVAVRNGWQVLAPDLPGYGLTRPAPGYRGDYGEWPAIVAAMADGTDGPVVLMGLSLGGMTAVLAAEKARRVDGVIVTSLLDMSDPSTLVGVARSRWLGRLSLMGIRIMPFLLDRIRVPIRLVAPMRAMSSDAQMCDYFATDPLLGRLWIGLRFFRTVHELRIDRLEPGCPLLVLHPGADAWTPPHLSRPPYDRVRGPKEFVELSGGAHLPLEQPAFNELATHMARFLGAAQRPEDQRTETLAWSEFPREDRGASGSVRGFPSITPQEYLDGG